MENNFLIQIYRKKIVLIFLLVLLFIFYYVSTKAILIVSLEGTSQSAPIQILDKGEGAESEKTLKTGLNLLNKGEYILKSHTSDSTTRLSVSAKSFKINRANIALKPQRSAKKIARDAGDCLITASGNSDSTEVFSYSCASPSHIFKNYYSDTPRKDIVVTNPRLFKPVAYEGGLVHIQKGPEEQIQLIHISPKEVKVIGKLTGQYTDKRFVVIAKQKNLYILDTINKQLIIYSKLNSDQNINLNLDNEEWDAENVSFDISNDKLYIASGATDPDSADEDTTFSAGRLWIFNISQKNGSSTKLSSSTKIDGELFGQFINFKILSNSLAFSLGENSELYIYRIENDKIIESDILPNVTAEAAVGSKLYLLIDGDVYMYDGGALYLAFDSSKITITSLSSHNGRLFFNGFSESESNPVNLTYELNDTDVSSGPRVENYLPYGDLELPIRWMDYSGDKIFVSLQLNSISFGTNGQAMYDQQEFENKKAAVLDQLTKDGFGRNKYAVSFTY